MRVLLKGALIIGVIILFVVAAAWLFLSSPFLSTPRTAMAQQVLTNKLGQQLVINENISVGLGSQLSVTATGIVMPSASLEGTDLAKIDTLRFSVAAADLVKGKLSISNLMVDGIHLNLIATENGKTSWSTGQKTDDASGPMPTTNAVSEIFADRELSLTNITVLYQSAQNGLDFDLRLPELTLASSDGVAVASANGHGTLNGQAFDLSAQFPDQDPFQVTAKFDQVSLAATEVQAKAGLAIATTSTIDELGQLLDILKLNRVLEGSGSAEAVLKVSEGVSRLDDLNIQAQLEGGQSLELTGQIGELGNPKDVSLTTRIRLYPEGAEPAPAASRYDLKLISVDMVMDSVPGEIPQRQMVIETNGFTLDTSGEGPPPVKFSEVSRTPDGKLRVGNVNLRIGDPANPFVILNGSVGDALQLQEVLGEGILEIPASSLISPELLGEDDQLGKFSGAFSLTGNIKQLSLSDLNGSTSDTDVWSLDVHGSVENVLKFENLDLGIEIDVPSGADLLQALSLEPVDTGHTGFSIDLHSDGTDWNAQADVTVADSGLTFSATLDDATSDPVLKGLIESDLIRIDQIRSIVLATAQLRKLGVADEDTTAETDAHAEPGALRDVTLKPIGRSILLSGMNMDVDIDLRHIEGSDGISTLQSELTLNESELKAGPLKFEYGGAHFDVSGRMDLSGEDHRLNLKGQAGGWRLNDILHNLNFKKGASGTIYADFDVTGGIDSAKHFVKSMSGNATVSMRDGSIETQLLDLAGLGLLPWVFSKEKQKVAPIVCLRAPLAIANGNISTKQTTLETDQVQVVVFGAVDMNNKALDLNLQPRKIGDPLSRSPWPVTATGPLAKPNIKVKDGPKRLKRSDGADQMPAKRKLCVPDILQLQ
ncbi:AsmA family protein [Ruegeria sp. HKCCA5426]|uniref:AsmA family protein n=1 Tax=Ruegeria sp. HKCCA5426 TaxID=2682985 RepID=UPI001487C00A